MVELALGGAPEWLGEPFKIDTIVRVKPIKKIFRFTKQTSSKSYRLSIPKEVVESMGINGSTHYLTFYSVEKGLVVIMFFQFEELFEVLEFSLGGGAQRESGFVGDLKGTIMYKLNAVGQLSRAYRKVWVSRNRSRKDVRYGVTIPQPVAEALNINNYTIFMMLYTPETRLLILELKSMVTTQPVKERVTVQSGERELTSPEELRAVLPVQSQVEYEP